MNGHEDVQCPLFQSCPGIAFANVRFWRYLPVRWPLQLIASDLGQSFETNAQQNRHLFSLSVVWRTFNATPST